MRRLFEGSHPRARVAALSLKVPKLPFGNESGLLPEQLEFFRGFEDKALTVTRVTDPPPSIFHSGMLPI